MIKNKTQNKRYQTNKLSHIFCELLINSFNELTTLSTFVGNYVNNHFRENHHLP